MPATYGTHSTLIGEAKRANAEITGVKLQITHVAFGDGKGEPLRASTELRNEVWRGPINSIEPHSSDPNVAVITSLLPSNVGGFYIREIGYFDSAGDLVAIGNLAESYHPERVEWQVNDQLFETNIIMSNAANVLISLDPTTVMATRDFVTNAMEPLFYAQTVEGINNLRDRFQARGENKALLEALENSGQMPSGYLTSGDNAMHTEIVGEKFEYLKNAFHPVYFSAAARVNVDYNDNQTAGVVTLYPFVPLARFEANGLRYWRDGIEMGDVYAAIYDRNGRFIGGGQDNHIDGNADAKLVIDFDTITLERNELYFVGFYHQGAVVRTSSHGSASIADQYNALLPNVGLTPDYGPQLAAANSQNNSGLRILAGIVGFGADMTTGHLSFRNYGPSITLRNAN